VFWQARVFLLTGLMLLIGGLYLAQHFFETIKSGAAYIFIVFLPAPMILFGLYALVSGVRQRKSSKEDGIAVIAPSGEYLNYRDNQNTKSYPLKKENQAEGNLQPKNKQLGCGSVMLYSFFIFGILVMLIIAVATAVIDIDKGVTHFCRRGRACPDIYLKDSPTSFYISLVLRTVTVLIIPASIGLVVKKWLEQK